MRWQRFDALAATQGFDQLAGRGALGQNLFELRTDIEVGETASLERAQHFVELQRRR
jgi:hypothetical protein